MAGSWPTERGVNEVDDHRRGGHIPRRRCPMPTASISPLCTVRPRATPAFDVPRRSHLAGTAREPMPQAANDQFPAELIVLERQGLALAAMVQRPPSTPYKPSPQVHLRAPGGCPISNKKQADFLAACRLWGAPRPGLSPGRGGSCATGAATPERLNLMPWSNQSGGGGGGGGGGPWGQGPSRRPAAPARPRRAAEAQPGQAQAGDARRLRAAGLGRVFLVVVVLAAVVAFFAFTFRVNPDELGVVMRFGKPIRSEPPGLHFRLPYPIEEVRLPKVTRQNIIEVGLRSGATSARLRRRRARRAGGEPDADRRREHRRRRFRRVLAHQGRASLPLQHPEPGGHRQGSGRERHARDRRPEQHPADPDRGAPEDRAGRAEADAGRARLLRRRHPRRPGADAEGRPAEPGDRRLPRRAGRARRQGAPAERGVLLRQPRRAGGARRGRAHPAGRQSLQGADRGRGHRPDGALPQGLRGIQEGARGDAQAHVPRDHGARARRHRQDHPRQQGRAGRGAVPAARPAAEEARKGPTDDTSTVGGPGGDCRRARGRRLFCPVHRARERAGDRAASSASR